MQLFAQTGSHELDPLQRFSLALMSALVLLTFVGTNMQALLWQSSDWLVSTVLPAVVIDLTNDQRLDNAAPELRRNVLLDQAAQAKAEHMAKNQYFAHYSPDGTTPWDFFQGQGYVYAHAGENLAIHFTDSAEVVDAWMLSPAHRKNIIDPKFREIGVGTARGTYDGYDTVYVVQLFGTPAVAAKPQSPINTPEPTPLAPAMLVESTSTPEPAPVVDLEPAAALATVSGESDTVNEGESMSEPATTQVAEVVAYREVPAPETSLQNDVLVIETELATSSGLAVATMVESSSTHAGATIASVVTRPNLVLQAFYGVVAGLIMLSLLYALVIEARRLHYLQVAYSLVLLCVMAGLWMLHTTLISGAIIV